MSSFTLSNVLNWIVCKILKSRLTLKKILGYLDSFHNLHLCFGESGDISVFKMSAEKILKLLSKSF